MNSTLTSQVVFHLTGRRGDAVGATELPAGLRPALMAPYRRLNDLRYDFPIVLADGPGEYALALSAIVDGALRAVAPEGPSGEGTRRRALEVERRIRQRVDAGERGTLRALWRSVAAEMPPAGEAGSVGRDMTAVLDAFACDGELVSCQGDVAQRFLRHAWSVVQRDKARAALARIDTLATRLEAILRADRARSAAALTGPSLQATFGPAHRELFDFAAMSRLLNSHAPRGGLSPSRRLRIETALATLRAQSFFAATDEANAALAAEFVFETTGAAFEAYSRRLPEMVALHRAMHVAELEAEGLYVEATHDPILRSLDAASLTAADLDFFPSFLVCTDGSSPGLLEALAMDAPLKVLVPVDDLLELPAPGRTVCAPGLGDARLATTAMSLGDAFVLQASASNLLQMRDAVQRGLRHPGPALFAIHAGKAAGNTALHPYLSSAAATQSRALPAFVYDPACGAGLAERFSLVDNPQLERDWPVERLTYADMDLQSTMEDVAFTPLDFALCDARYAEHFAVVPRSEWSAGMVPAEQWLREPPADRSTAAPYILAVDEADLLCRVVVDEPLIRAALRCRQAWRRLQELAGVHDSRIERALAREREASARQAPAAAAPPASAPVIAEPAAPVAEAAPASAVDPDVAFIETLRCSSCNECTLAFPKMFAYNDDKQAYIKDVRAGTYRQLVEAAESCQVSVIHPGRPWNPDEPGLEELLERAKPFLPGAR